MAIGPRGSRFKSLGAFKAGGIKVPATLTTAVTGTNNDLKYTARNSGLAGNSITVAYVVAGNNTPLTVSVTGNAITVNSATNGSAVATSTATQVAAAVAANSQANYLVKSENAAGNDGTGAVAALSATALTGGTDWVIGR